MDVLLERDGSKRRRNESAEPQSSGSDNSNSLEAPQLDWYPGNRLADSAPYIYIYITHPQRDGKAQRAIRERKRGN